MSRTILICVTIALSVFVGSAAYMVGQFIHGTHAVQLQLDSIRPLLQSPRVKP